MYRATRELIKARQIHTNYMVEKVLVTQIGGGRENDCFNNAYEYQEINKQCGFVSGWLVNKYDSLSKSTAILQHFWNVNENGVFVDTTPNIDSECDYVIDVDLSKYGQEHYDEIANCVCSSLWLKDGRFKTVDLIEGRMVENEISELRTENLFEAVKIENILDSDYLSAIEFAPEMEAV